MTFQFVTRSTMILILEENLKLSVAVVCAIFWTDTKINQTLCKLQHFGLSFKYQHEHKSELPQISALYMFNKKYDFFEFNRNI